MAKDDIDAWNEELDDKAAPSLGVNRELLRKALEMNPSLRQSAGSTVEIMDKIEKGQAAGQAAAQAGKPSGQQPTRDLLKAFAQLKERFVEEDKKLKAEIAQLQTRHKELSPQTLDRLIQTLVELDPNLTSIQTQELIKMEQVFLNQIGFTARKVIERRMGKKN